MAYDENPTATVKPLEPEFLETTTSDSLQSGLTGREITDFKRDGYLVKRGLIKDTDPLERIVSYTWNRVPRGIIKRDLPATWLSKPHQKWTETDAKQVGNLHRGNWKMRSPNGLGTEPFILSSTANHPAVRKVVRHLIGDPVKPADRVRGVYVVLPKPIDVEGSLGPHVDHAAAQVSAMVILDETPRRCGGFTIWPGSHTLLHEYWDTCYSAYISDQHKDEFQRVFREILSSVPPLEFCGEAGDVVFWHSRLIHSAGVNYSAETSRPRIRFVVPCDFQHSGLDYFDDDDLGPGPSAQWWVCTRHWREDIPPTATNLWHDWAFQTEEEMSSVTSNV